MIEHSPELGDLAAALSKAQAEIKGAVRDSENPTFASRYADLASVWEACRPALTSNGLSVAQAPYSAGASVGVTTMLLHASGQWLRTSVAAEPVDLSPQAVVSVVTYLRRTALAAISGVAPVDDDGEAAQPRATRGPTTEAQARAAFPDPVSEEVEAAIVARFTKGSDLRCPICKTKRVIPYKNGSGWFCSSYKGGCGAAWKVAPAAGSDPVGVDPVAGEVSKARDPVAVDQERKALLLKAKKLSDAIGLSLQDRKNAWQTYTGGATEENVDPSALHGLVAWLETRCAK